MNGTLLSNIAIPIINDLPTGLVLPLITLLSSTIDGLSNLGTLLSSLIEGVSGLGNSAVSSLLPPIIISAEKVTGVNIIYLAAVTPEIITLKGVVYNPTSQLLYINYTYIMLQEYDTLSGVGGPTTLGQIVGMVQVPVNMYVYPGTYQDIDLKVGIPLTLPNVLLNNLLSNSDNQGPATLTLSSTYRVLTIETYTNMGLISSGQFILPSTQPPVSLPD